MVAVLSCAFVRLDGALSYFIRFAYILSCSLLLYSLSLTSLSCQRFAKENDVTIENKATPQQPTKVNDVLHFSPHPPKYSSAVFEVKCPHRSHGTEQNMVQGDEAICRTRSQSILQRPKIDRLRPQRRAIYDVQYTSSKIRKGDSSDRQRIAFSEAPTSSTSTVVQAQS